MNGKERDDLKNWLNERLTIDADDSQSEAEVACGNASRGRDAEALRESVAR